MNDRASSVVQWLSPAPPLRTGIANYTDDFFQAVDGLWQIAAYLEDGSILDEYEYATVVDGDLREPDPALPTVIHVGNSEFHERAFSLGSRLSGILVLHDVVLHHALAANALRTGRSREYWRDLERLYGSEGTEAGRALLAGRSTESIERFPLSERFIEAARATVVHSEYAAGAVSQRADHAAVRIVPMGIPIPAVIPKHEARVALGLPNSAFIVASISHVNPYKRIDVVLRALRRLVARLPEALFVIAGTGSDSTDLAREIRVLGLSSHVVQLGYVDERTARLIASASDACVNLRYPTTGETSASLLRLLGAGLPVLVTDAGASSELPDGVGLKVPVGRHEVEIVTELLWALHDDDSLRADAGRVARDFVIANHSLSAEVAGYRSVIQEFYGLELPVLRGVPREYPILMDESSRSLQEQPFMVGKVAEAISDLGISRQDSIVRSAAAAIVDLGLDAPPRSSAAEPSQRLITRLRCTGCGGDFDDALKCIGCDEQAATTDGLPDFRWRRQRGEAAGIRTSVRM